LDYQASRTSGKKSAGSAFAGNKTELKLHPRINASRVPRFVPSRSFAAGERKVRGFPLAANDNYRQAIIFSRVRQPLC
jgi:hypothetical protein